MTRQRMTKAAAGPRPSGPMPASARPSVLVIGIAPPDLKRLPRHILAPNAIVTRLAHPKSLRARHMTGAKAPSLVISPLETERFDAVDLVRWLSRGRYRGRYLALANSEPDIPLIRDEIQGQAPKLNFDVVAMDGRSALHSV